MRNGPFQLVVIGFADTSLSAELVRELTRLRDRRIVGLTDVLLVTKDEHGSLTASQVPGYGAAVASLIGLGCAGDEALREGALVGDARDDGEVWFATDAIPPGTSAAITLIEHRWAIPLRDTIAAAGAVTVRDAWVHPADLVLIDGEPGEPGEPGH